MHKNIYNSDFSRVVYPAHENGLPTESIPMIIMRNLENDTDILTVPTIMRYGSSPVWSPDGNYFAIAISIDHNYTEEYINIFNRDGEIVFQTDASTTEMQETIYSMSWSPDSKHLAFVYVLDESSGYTYHLGVLDVEEEKITLYCSPEVYQYTQLYWSPDNRYLLYPSQAADSDEISSYILNIESGQNILVMDGYFPGGWMK
jgi:Tol biopolymer transport system component